MYGDQHVVCVENLNCKLSLIFRSRIATTRKDFNVNRPLTLILRLLHKILDGRKTVKHFTSQLSSVQFCREGFSANRAKFMNQFSDWLLTFPSQAFSISFGSLVLRLSSHRVRAEKFVTSDGLHPFYPSDYKPQYSKSFLAQNESFLIRFCTRKKLRCAIICVRSQLSQHRLLLSKGLYFRDKSRKRS